jgi:hypothetical protein
MPEAVRPPVQCGKGASPRRCHESTRVTGN